MACAWTTTKGSELWKLFRNMWRAFSLTLSCSDLGAVAMGTAVVMATVRSVVVRAKRVKPLSEDHPEKSDRRGLEREAALGQRFCIYVEM